MVEERSYKGKKVFVGIDVHSKKYVCAAVCSDAVVKQWTTAPDNESLVSQLKRNFVGAQIYSAYEAGFSGLSLHRALLKGKIKNIVIHPGHLQIRANDRVKTDKRDAKKIAKQLSTRDLKAIYVPSETEEAKRSLSRGRANAVRRVTAASNKLKMKLYYLGLEVWKTKISETYLKKLESLNLPHEHKFAISELILEYREAKACVKRFDNELAKQATTDKLEAIYRSVPGVGKTSSRVLSNELGDMSRFDNVKQLYSYLGLTPSEYSSGEHVRKGRITRQGPARNRSVLTEVAWRAISKSGVLKSFYNRLARKRDSNRAIIAVARKLAGQIRGCLLRNELWNESKMILNNV